jgi:hypothetical protein
VASDLVPRFIVTCVDTPSTQVCASCLDAVPSITVCRGCAAIESLRLALCVDACEICCHNRARLTSSGWRCRQEGDARGSGGALERKRVEYTGRVELCELCAFIADHLPPPQATSCSAGPPGACCARLCTPPPVPPTLDGNRARRFSQDMHAPAPWLGSLIAHHACAVCGRVQGGRRPQPPPPPPPLQQ